ncbi:MAG: hypothetical protein COB08_009490 [Rhodobacteraceae bacterium]|nr:hypothetical protein [Paracoccaceae bacterium]
MLASGNALGTARLWLAEENQTASEWREVKAALAEDELDWRFWIKWYEATLAGAPLPWELLERIALEVTDEDWKRGPKHVDLLIAEIELDFAVKATPNGELIVVTSDEKYASIPRSDLPPKTLKDAFARISDVVSYMRNSQKNSNQYSPLLSEADFLEDQLKRYGDNALRLHEACSKVVIHVLRYVTAGTLPENDNVVGDVVSDLQNTADDIYNLDVEARTTLDARERLRYDRLSEAQKADAVRIANAIAQQSTKEFGEEMVEDGLAIASEDEPSEDTKSNRYRFVSRTLKIIAIGGAGLVGITAALSQAEPAVNGAVYLWKLIAPFLGL